MIVGWQLATHMRTELVLDALEMANGLRRPGEGLIAHSDRGSQYTSIRYTGRLDELGAAPSVGSRGDAYDNAMAEAWVATFKTELVDGRRFPSFEHAEHEVLHWIGFYNDERLHEALGDLPPDRVRGRSNIKTDNSPMVAATDNRASNETQGGSTVPASTNVSCNWSSSSLLSVTITNVQPPGRSRRIFWVNHSIDRLLPDPCVCQKTPSRSSPGLPNPLAVPRSPRSPCSLVITRDRLDRPTRLLPIGDEILDEVQQASRFARATNCGLELGPGRGCRSRRSISTRRTVPQGANVASRRACDPFERITNALSQKSCRVCSVVREILIVRGPHRPPWLATRAASGPEGRSRRPGVDRTFRTLRRRIADLPAGRLYGAGRRGWTVNPSVPSTLTAPVFPPSKSPEARRWPVANS